MFSVRREVISPGGPDLQATPRGGERIAGDCNRPRSARAVGTSRCVSKAEVPNRRAVSGGVVNLAVVRDATARQVLCLTSGRRLLH